MHRWLLFLLLVPAPVTPSLIAVQSTDLPQNASGKMIPTSFVARTPEGERQIILVELTSDGLRDVIIRISSADWPKSVEVRFGEIAKGKQVVRLEAPVATKNGSVRASVESASGSIEVSEAELTVPRKWTIYLSEHTHTDIGYTRPQTEILPEHLRYIDYALDYCDLTDSYPDDAKFRWTCEISWAVREYLKRRPPQQIERLKRRVAESRIELTGMFLNMSEIADENSLAASLNPLREMQATFGKVIRSAMQDDVNGAGWCLPDFYSGIGVRYLIMGINKTRSILPFERPTPFWWESPSGKRLLAFRADHYMTGNSWGIHEGSVPRIEPGLAAYLNQLAKSRYPFDRIGVQFSGYATDNSPPAAKECDLVKLWNETYAWPRLRIATAGEFPAYIEQNHAASLPVHRQAWPDWWTDGFGSAARETAASRDTHAATQINEGLMAIASALGAKPRPGWAERDAAVQEALLFYDEHTFGAAESISDPTAQNSMVQWGEKSAYVWEAVKNAAMQREEALGLLQSFIPRSKVPTLAVFNTLGHERSGLVQVFVDHEIIPQNRRFRIVDARNGEEIAAQPLASRAEGTYWAIWAKDVPALGFGTYRIEVERENAIFTEEKEKPTLLENRFYQIRIDPQTGAVKSLKDKETGKELSDEGSRWQLGQFIYESTKDRDFEKPSFLSKNPFERTTLRNVRIVGFSSGPIWKSIALKGEAEGCAKPDGVTLEIRLFETEKRIEFHYSMRKLPVASPEAVYVAFPFGLTGSTFVYEAQGGILTPGEGQLPGAASDWQTMQNFIALRDGEGQVVLGSGEVPLIQLGDINLGKWMPVTRIEKPYLYSWVMNNYWFTNFRASQDGEFRWVYYLTSGKNRSNTLATDFGWSSRIPLVGRVLTSGLSQNQTAAISALGIDARNVALIASRPARDGNGIILHLREVEGKQTQATLSTSIPESEAMIAAEVNVLEEPIAREEAKLTFAPFEAKFVRVTIPRK